MILQDSMPMLFVKLIDRIPARPVEPAVEDCESLVVIGVTWDDYPSLETQANVRDWQFSSSENPNGRAAIAA